MKLTGDYRLPRESLSAIARKDRPVVVMMKEVWKDWGLCLGDFERRKTFLRRLTPGQRAFLFVLSLDSQVQSDGFYLYLWNSGEDAPFAVEALKEIGATKYAAILESTLTLFRSRRVLGNRRMRQATLKRYAERELNERFQRPFDALNGRKKGSLTAFLVDYLERHPDDFFMGRGDRSSTAASEPAFVDHRVPRSKAAKLRGEKLHWVLVEPVWEDYCAATRPKKERDSRRLDRLVSNLTPGQRALVAAKLFDNAVRIIGCGHAVNDLAPIHREILAAYQLLGANAYAELFHRMVALSTQWNDALAESERPIRRIVERRKRLGIVPGDPRFAGVSNAFWNAYDQQMRLQQRLSRGQKAWRREYLALGKRRSAKLERLVEDYVASHPDEFFRD